MQKFHVIAAAIVATTTAHAGGIAFKEAPKQTAAQAKHFNWVNDAGGLKCEPKGKLAELVGDPYKCYIKLDECKAAVDTLAGKIDPAYIELFADLAAIDPNAEKAKFVNTCPSDNGPMFVELLAIRGLGYSRDAKYAPLLAQIVDGKRAHKVGANLTFGVTEALAYMGNKAAAEPAYKNLLAVKSLDSEYKTTILQMLGQWDSDAGVDFCTAALTADDEKKSLDACIFYLGRRKVTTALPALIRNFEKAEDVTLRAFGQLGSKDALETINGFLDAKPKAHYRTRVPALVAAVNLGDKKALAELQIWAAGKKPVDPKAKKSKNAKETIDQEMIGAVAMESLLLTDKAAIAALKKPAEAAAAKVDPANWRGSVYATIALAQRGDAKARTALAKLLEHPKAEIRNAVIDAVGGREMHVRDYWLTTGFGYVADAGLATALENYLAAESDKAQRVRAINALGMTRGMLAATAN